MRLCVNLYSIFSTREHYFPLQCVSPPAALKVRMQDRDLQMPIPLSKKISMTIPTTQSNENGSNVMQFFLPSNFTKKNAPSPVDKDLRLINIEQGYYAVIRYSGRLTDKNFDKYRKILKDYLLKDKIKILNSAIRATYNGPFTLPFLRRNEVMFLVAWEDK